MAVLQGQDLAQFQRFAVYYAAAPGSPLADFGASWLGWDIDTGRARAHPPIAGAPKPIGELTQTPRKYGFHATLKPPMRIAAGMTPEALLNAVATLAAEQRPVVLEGLEVSALGSFVALTPRGDVTALGALARRLVKGLDYLRAPLNAAELEKRRASRLDARQEDLLRLYGYPYVLDQFRFHMTLSGRLSPDEATELCRVLAPHTSRILPGRVLIDAITLVGEGADGMFRTIRRFGLNGDRAQS